jgi:hypothetical protein
MQIVKLDLIDGRGLVEAAVATVIEADRLRYAMADLRRLTEREIDILTEDRIDE